MSARVTANGNSTLKAHGRRLIYFSSVPYASYEQRPHFMAAAFLNGGFDFVLWIDPYPTRFPTFGDLMRICRKPAAVEHDYEARIRVLRPRALPIEPVPLSGVINHFLNWRKTCAQLHEFTRQTDHCVLAIGRPSKLAEWALKHIPHNRSFVDILDKFPAFYRGLSKVSMKVRMDAACQKVTDVYCSSSKLALDMRANRNDVQLVLNGYATELLPKLSDQGSRLCIGYVGSIAKWFDWKLVRSIALALPEVTVRLVGPEFISRPVDLPGNIEFIGEQPNKKVGEIVSQFAVGLIPFTIDDLTSGVDPIKFYEYRSMGIPIWSTDFGEMHARGPIDEVTHVSSESDWTKLWKLAQINKPNFDQIEIFRAEVDWGKRFAPVLTRSKIVLASPKRKVFNKKLPTRWIFES